MGEEEFEEPAKLGAIAFAHKRKELRLATQDVGGDLVDELDSLFGQLHVDSTTVLGVKAPFEQTTALELVQAVRDTSRGYQRGSVSCPAVIRYGLPERRSIAKRSSVAGSVPSSTRR